MRRPAIERALGARLGRSLLASSLRRLLLWACASTQLLVLGSILGYLLAGAGLLGEKSAALASPALSLLLLSLLPAFLAWPARTARLRASLRAADPETSVEAWLDAPAGPARALLDRRVEERAAALAHESPPPERPFAGLGPAVAASILAVLILEIASFALSGKLILPGAAPPPLARGSGLRVDEARPEGGEGELLAPERGPRDDFGEEEQGGGSGQALAEDELAALDPEGLGAARRQGGAGPGEDPAGEGGAETAREAPPGPTPGAPAGRKGVEGRRAEGAGAGEAGPGEDGRGAEGSGAGDNAGKGWERSGTSLGASPLVDYRTRFESALLDAERSGKPGTSAAIEKLSLGELREFQRRYFSSFTLPSSLAPREDPYSLLLKRRWRELRGGPR